MRRRLSKQEKVIFSIFILGLAALCLWHFHLGAVVYSYREAYEAREELLARRDLAEEYLKQEAALKRELSEWQEKEDARVPFALPGELALVVMQLQLLFEEAPVTMETFRIGHAQSEEEGRKVMIMAEVVGEPEDLRTLVSDLEGFPWILLVDGLSWENMDEGTARRMLLNARLILKE